MKEFINLDEQESEIIPNHPHSISNIRPDTQIVDGIITREEVEGICADYSVITIDKIEEILAEDLSEQICIKDDCDSSKYYGCASGDGAFQKDNLFSELTDEYQRTQARINLGIADEYAMVWGNIKGNLSNQKDLYIFVTDSIAFDINKVIEEINLKLAQWACEIEIRFKNKADVFSPNLAGKPTTTLPLITDNSNRIASTEWVNAKIASASIDDNVRAISLDPEYMCYGDAPTDVTVAWDYYKEVDQQSINGITVPNNIRSYLFSGQTTSMVVTLKYTYGEITASKVVTFDIKYPIYYGVSPDYTKLKTTVNNSFEITTKSNEYMYIMIPNGLNALLAVSSIIGGFKLLGTQDIFGNLYYVFRSANLGLGECTIEIMNQGNFESGEFDTTSIKELLATKADKYAVYDKDAIDQMFDDFATGEGSLKNYYTKIEVDNKIPDVSQKADKSELPSFVSDLANDVGYISSIPDEYITDLELLQKGYLTQELEPSFSASIAKTITSGDVVKWNNKVDKVDGKGLSSNDFTLDEKAKLKGLFNYDDTNINNDIAVLAEEIDNKADRTEIPDISQKADKTEIPTKVSQLTNDAQYLTTLPGGLITEEALNAKGYLTEFTETDPTVPAWAKEPNRPVYTLEDIGAEAKGTADIALSEAKAYTDEHITAIVDGADSSYATLKSIQTVVETTNTNIGTINTKLEEKANRTELFSKKYTDLTGTPSIPSIAGLASETYVQQQISSIPSIDLTDYAKREDIPDITNKVDKVDGKGLSSADFTYAYEEKLSELSNYDDSTLKSRVANLEKLPTFLIVYEVYKLPSLESYFDSFDAIVDYLETLVNSGPLLVEYADNKYTTIYSKTVLDLTDSSDNRTLTITLYGKLDVDKDIQLVFEIYDGEVQTSSYIKTEIPIVIDRLDSLSTTTSLSAAQGKILLDRLKALEEIVNNVTPSNSIILE